VDVDLGGGVWMHCAGAELWGTSCMSVLLGDNRGETTKSQESDEHILTELIGAGMLSLRCDDMMIVSMTDLDAVLPWSDIHVVYLLHT
jgi:hypothetical protein